MEQLLQALHALTREIREDRLQRLTEFEWSKAHSGLATKQDVTNAKNEIIKAFGERIDPAALKKETSDLKASADALKKGVEANQPISG